MTDVQRNDPVDGFEPRDKAALGQQRPLFADEDRKVANLRDRLGNF